MRKLIAIFLCTIAFQADAAECVGENLITRMSAAQQAEMRDALTDIPYRHGLLWRADKGDMRVYLVGTYHFADPRHALTMEKVGPFVDDAERLMVEAGPEEMAKLTEAMVTDLSILSITEGPTLPERLTPEQWTELSDVMRARGMPPAMVSRLRPWYVAMMMGMSPCMLAQAAEAGKVTGLDQMLIARAEEASVPISALEPWDTVFSLFDEMTPQEEIEMILGALPVAQYADDYAATLIEAYFTQDVWQVWEFGRIDAYETSGLSRAQVDAQYDLAETKLMVQRNESWIAPLTKAATDAAATDGYVVAGFGALHLPGEKGVLQLLADAGWTITPVEAPDYGASN